MSFPTNFPLSFFLYFFLLLLLISSKYRSAAAPAVPGPRVPTTGEGNQRENETGSDAGQENARPKDPIKAVRFMRQFGYLESVTPEAEAIYAKDTIRDALLLVQKFGAIEQTGVLDEATLRLMDSRRCGVHDILPESNERQRKKRYVIGSKGWAKRNITYRIVNWSPKLGKATTEREFRKAFEIWSDYSRLKFSPAPPYHHADIEILFARGPHGDGYPLDGQGGVLAHAFYPYEAGHWGGDMHFDEDEEWRVRPAEDQGVDIFMVAVHELGHSLGLAHSFVPTSVMFPYYRGPVPDFRLDYDDIHGLYQLYISTYTDDEYEDNRNGHKEGVDEDDERNTGDGEEGREEGSERERGEDAEEGEREDKEAGRKRGRDETGNGEDKESGRGESDEKEEDSRENRNGESTTERNRCDGDCVTVDDHIGQLGCQAVDICKGSIDGASILRDELFFFKGECVWRLKDRGIIKRGYPVPIRQLFQFLPENIRKIDAVYQRLNDSAIVIFTGKNFWVSDGDRLIQNSPRPLSDYGLPATLDKINAIMVWGKNDKTFIFSDDRYWRFNETTALMDAGYPKPMERWRGVPKDLDAAFTWTDGATYFFHGPLFWRFDNILIKTDVGFPLSTSDVWLGCS